MKFTMGGVPEGFVAYLGDKATFSECTKIYQNGEELPEGLEGWYCHLVPAERQHSAPNTVLRQTHTDYPR
jgi:hypothetical protein